MASTTCMGDGEMGYLTLQAWGSHRLRSLAQQLQFYKPPNPLDSVDEEETEGVCEPAVARNTLLSSFRATEKRAAVLICLFETEQGELRVILTKRSNRLSTHPGEVALPGGKMDEGDEDEIATALRESMEEIGLDPALVRVVTFLEPFISKHLLRVVPVVGLLVRPEDFKPVLNTDEVDAIFDAPLEMFLEENNHRYEKKQWMEWEYMVHLFDYESEEQGSFLIWGLTASILVRVSSIIYQRKPSFPEHDLPDFQGLHKISMSLW